MYAYKFKDDHGDTITIYKHSKAAVKVKWAWESGLNLIANVI